MKNLQDCLKFSALESKRFNANIYRGIVDQLSARDLIDFVFANNVDHIFFRINSDKLDQLIKIENTPFPYLVADTLLYYKCNLQLIKPVDLYNKDITFVRADMDDVRLLEELVERIFTDYRNHYYSNPFLDKRSIIDGYKEWVVSYLKEEKSKLVFKAIKQAQTVAFATCSFNKDEKTCEGVLYGVLPEHAGERIYTDLIRYTKNYFQEKSYKIMSVSTQSHNYAVQKAWSREHFFISESYNTIHINSLFNKSDLNKSNLEVEFTEEDVNNFIALSGDNNKLHTSDQYAREKGFDSRIVHGVLINSLLSKYFGKSYPGDGTIFMNYRYYYFNPLYINNRYNMEISYPRYIKDNNRYYVLVKVFDANNNICVISYNNLIRK